MRCIETLILLELRHFQDFFNLYMRCIETMIEKFECLIFILILTYTWDVLKLVTTTWTIAYGNTFNLYMRCIETRKLLNLCLLATLFNLYMRCIETLKAKILNYF